jgi:hypothetical protein
MTWHPETLTDPSQAQTSASSHTAAPWNPIKELSAAHVEMLKLHVQGVPVSKIVIRLKRYGETYSSRHIKRVLESDKGRQYASAYSALYYGGLAGLVIHGMEHSPEALSTELNIMRNPIGADRHRLAAAQDVMDRFGPPKISRQETENRQPTTVVINLTPSQLSQFAAPPAQIAAETVRLLEQPSSADD